MRNNQRMRPQMEDYVEQNKPATTTSHYEQNNIQNRPFKTPGSQQPQYQEQNNTARESQEENTVTRTSQAHKIKEKDYKINPKVIPRPNHFDEVYKLAEKFEPVYETNEDVHPPHSSVYYTVNETQNSSCRFIRSTLTKIPTDQSQLNSSSLPFGLYIQPFAEINENEKEVPKVEINEQIFRCRRCNSYINSKYEITYSKANKQVAICNLCLCENELDTSKSSVKNEYFNSMGTYVPELKCPTVDFDTPNNMKHTVPFAPHYIFMIDISLISCELGLPTYILNSISSNVDFIHASANSYISIATYDSKSIHFFAVDANKEVKAYIVSDIQNPFCPVPRTNLFLHVEEQKDLISKLIERINVFISERQNKINATRKNMPGSVTGAAIVAAANALEENGGRVMVFTCNTCVSGFGACRPREEAKQAANVNEKNIYLPQHTQFNSLTEYFTQKRIVIDQFILANYQFDLATFSVLSNQTGGSIIFYPINTKDYSDVKFKFEKVHYDLSRILTRPNYYDVKFMLRLSMGIETIEILGPFGKKLGEAFQVAGCDPDYSFFYNLRLTESMKNNQRCHFQIVCLYIDNFNQRYLRILNYTVVATNEISKIYSSTDVDALSKLSMIKEISLSQHLEVSNGRDNIVNRIVNSFLFYRQNCSKTTPSAQLILPASIKYFPVYMNSFVKKFIARKNKQGQGIPANLIVDFINKRMREPLSQTIKHLYPKFYRVDDIQYDQSSKFTGLDSDYIIKDVGCQNEKYDFITKPYLLPNSFDNVDFDCAYLSDDGEYITLYVFNHIEPKFYQELFGVDSWEEAVNLNLDTLDESNANDLNVRILNIVNQLRKDNKGMIQPLRVLFLDDKSYNNPELINILIEDKAKSEPNYVDFLCTLHEEIQKKMA